MSIDMPDYTKWIRERPVETITIQVDELLGMLSLDDIITVIGHDIEVESLEVSCDNANLQLLVSGFDASGVLSNTILVAQADGTNFVFVSPANVYSETHDLFDVLVYDVADEKFKIVLTRKLRFAHGIDIWLFNPNPFPVNVLCSLTYIDRGVIP